MPQPFFSIVIPTRGRPELFRDALASALWQDFDDYEVVASDNYNDGQTQAVLDEFKEDHRLRSVRTDRLLNMPEHWDFATQHARGRYVLILTDRSVLKQGALKTIHAAIISSEASVEVCSWPWSVYSDSAGRETDNQAVLQEGNVHRITSVQLLEDFSSGRSRYNKCLPRGLNSCYENAFLKRMRDEFGSPFRPVNPDYFLAFASLGITREILFIDRHLFISQGIENSNGTNNFKRTCEGYLKSLGDYNVYAYVPIKSPTCYNVVYEDFLAAQEVIGGNLKKVGCDWPGYFAYCYSELLSKKSWGYMSPDELQNLFDEWERALLTFDEATQATTKEKVEKLSQSVTLKQQRETKQEISLTCLCLDRIKRLIHTLANSFRNVEQKDAVSLARKQKLSALELAGF